MKDEAKEFEKSVIKVARELWPNAQVAGSIILEERERDGFFITEENVHVIECTISKTKDKAQNDIDKIDKLFKTLEKRYPEKSVKGWFVTKNEPTPDQKAVGLKINKSISIMSYEQFRNKLISTDLYFTLRSQYAFGSARDLSSGSHNIKDKYIQCVFNSIGENESSKDAYEFKDIIEKTEGNNILVILGHYGVGKSMSLYEMYRILVNKFQKKQNAKFPIYINLRDHHGQTDPVEVLERHSRMIGFPNPNHLVRAWRAGYAYLLLDGFDEIAAFGWAGKINKLKDIRYNSMELIRKFINSSLDFGITICGRSNFFDTVSECKKALDITRRNPVIVEIGDFSDQQINEYLNQKKINIISVPDWLPSRPLLIGYLVANGILMRICEENASNTLSEAEGWDYLLDAISDREASIEAGLSSETIREIIEGLSSYSRKLESQIGPIFEKDLEKIFFEKCGYQPDDRALTILQRLPGLTQRDSQDGSRYFVDNQLASVARAGEVYRFIINPHDYNIYGEPQSWFEALNNLSLSTLNFKLTNIEKGILWESLRVAKSKNLEVLSCDIVLTINQIGQTGIKQQVVITEVIVPELELNRNSKLSNITFSECMFFSLTSEEKDNLKNSPYFVKCYFENIIGCESERNLPAEHFQECEFINFEIQQITTSALLSLDLPTKVRVALTILKKIFLQSTSGRQENALFRGLPDHDHGYVKEILLGLSASGIISASTGGSSNKIWKPNKNYSKRVRDIIYNRSYNDPIISKFF